MLLAVIDRVKLPIVEAMMDPWMVAQESRNGQKYPDWGEERGESLHLGVYRAGQLGEVQAEHILFGNGAALRVPQGLNCF